MRRRLNHWRRDSKGVARARIGGYNLESAKTPDGEGDYYWRIFGADGAALRAMRGYETEWDARTAAETAAGETPPADNIISLADYR